MELGAKTTPRYFLLFTSLGQMWLTPLAEMVHQGLRMQMWVILTCPRALHQLQGWEKVRESGKGTGREKHSRPLEHSSAPISSSSIHSFIHSTKID